MGTSLYVPKVRERLRRELSFLTCEGLVVELEERENHSWIFFTLRSCQSKRQGENKIACRFAVAKAVSDLVIDQIEFNFVKKFVNRYYHYLSLSDQEEISTRTLEILNNLKVIRRNKILQNLYDYLAEYQVLIIEGYTTFRLKSHWNQLRRLIKRTGQEFMATKDYMEFVCLLRFFLQMQKPKAEEVHVLVTSNGIFYLCDQLGNVIRGENLRIPFFHVSSKGEFDYRDYLLSALIALAPKKLVFHVPETIWCCEPIQTVQQVFGRRAVRCPGCEKCQHLYVHKS